MKTLARSVLIVSLGFGIAATPLVAAEMSPTFRDSLTKVAADEPVGAVLMMRDRIRPEGLRSALRPWSGSRQALHGVGVELLRARAARTQVDLLRFLESERDTGRVHEVRSLWITNAVLVEATPSVLLALAERADVEAVYPTFPIELVEPAVWVGIDPGGADAPSIEPGIAATNAPALWAEGITGVGRLVSHLDTGVAGTHPAYADRWRGRLPWVDPAAAWFDPVTQTTFPFDSGSHGTHTMGTIAGRDGEDVIGMAWGADWISAGVIDRTFDINRTIADALLAFEWIVDPDADPFTIEDVPDVVSNSWGISPFFHGVPKCDDTFWEVLENVEALGTVVVFAAGNEGPTQESLRTPADALLGPTSVFSVAALEQNQTSIAGYSSRGPSGCDDVTVKPEVAAQGDNVRSAFPGGSYGRLSGTSMAAPHVAGAVALLRQIDPDASPTTVKQALMDSAVDLGAAGPDNTFGRGRIDVEAAADLLRESLPTVTIDALAPFTRVGAGEPLPAFLQLANTGDAGATVVISGTVTDALGTVLFAAPDSTRNLPAGANNYLRPSRIQLDTTGLPVGEALVFTATLEDTQGVLLDSSSFSFIVD